jgi:hypothetical protein
VTVSPAAPISTPASAGPSDLVTLKAPELSATAFISVLRGTSAGSSAWRAGCMNAWLTPTMKPVA